MAKPNVKKVVRKNKPDNFSRRSFVLLAVQMGVIGVLAWRMRQLQIEDSDRYRLLAEENRINTRLIPPIRGLIFDKNGKIIANNRQNYRIVIIREEADDIQKVLENLSKLIPISSKTRDSIGKEIMKYKPFVPVTVAEDLTWENFAKVAANLPSLPGLMPEVGYSRSYTENEIMAHIVGYVGPASKADIKRLPKSNPLFQIPNFPVGKTGIERELNSRLTGSAGVSRQEVNATGRVMRELTRDIGKPGEDIQLTINTELQKFAMKRMKDLSASAVVLDAKNGDILAMSSTPSFDPNKIVSGISNKDWQGLLSDEKRPLSNKSVSDAYPPGSLFKMVVAISALETGVISSLEEINCTGMYEVGESKHHCWLATGHGKMNLIKAIKRSCDVYFYKIAQRVGIEAIAATSKKFGFSQTFELPVSAISSGLIPTKAWKRSKFNTEWLLGDTLNVGIGQGYILSTPMQIAVMTARLSQGRAIIPHLVNALDGKIIPRNYIDSIKVQDFIFSEIRKGMISAVNDEDGTAYKSRIINPKFKLAGKTGTAQVRRITELEREQGVTKNEDLPWSKRDHALFTGYAPIENPKYAISVIVEHGGGGSAVAAPIARDIILYALHEGIPPLSSYPADERKKIRPLLKQLENEMRNNRSEKKQGSSEAQT